MSRCRPSTRARAQAPRASWPPCCARSSVPSLLVTHDFAEAAQLGDRVGVIDAGRIVQEGTPTELAADPRSAFVADFTGAVVLTGTASAGADGLTRVELDGGGTVTSTDPGTGRVALSVHPWEIALEPDGEAPHGSAQNRLSAEVLSVTTVGNRVRLGLAAPQPLQAEITAAAARDLAFAPAPRHRVLEGRRHPARHALAAQGDCTLRRRGALRPHPDRAQVAARLGRRAHLGGVERA